MTVSARIGNPALDQRCLCLYKEPSCAILQLRLCVQSTQICCGSVCMGALPGDSCVCVYREPRPHSCVCVLKEP